VLIAIWKRYLNALNPISLYSNMGRAWAELGLISVKSLHNEDLSSKITRLPLCGQML